MKKLIINADDFGLTDGVCRGIAELMEVGIVTDTTVMMAVPRAAERAVAFGGKDLKGRLGLHLQLTSGRALSAVSEVPSLVNGDGKFPKRAGLGLPNADEVALEWVRQVDAFEQAFGFLPNHLDTHHSVQDLPGLGDVYLGLAAMLGVPVRPGRIAATLEQCAVHGVKRPDFVVADWTGRSFSGAELVSALKPALAMHCVVELLAHPGYSDDGLRAISSLADEREDDLQDLLNLQESGWLEEQGIRLAGYGEAFG